MFEVMFYNSFNDVLNMNVVCYFFVTHLTFMFPNLTVEFWTITFTYSKFNTYIFIVPL